MRARATGVRRVELRSSSIRSAMPPWVRYRSKCVPANAATSDSASDRGSDRNYVLEYQGVAGNN